MFWHSMAKLAFTLSIYPSIKMEDIIIKLLLISDNDKFHNVVIKNYESFAMR